MRKLGEGGGGPITATPKSFGMVLDSVQGLPSVEQNVGRKGENELSILITQAILLPCDVTGLSSVPPSSLPVYGTLTSRPDWGC